MVRPVFSFAFSLSCWKNKNKDQIGLFQFPSLSQSSESISLQTLSLPPYRKDGRHQDNTGLG